jgi:hypothetical protein
MRISAHFALEEGHAGARLSEVGAHKADHELLLDDIRDIMDEHIERGVWTTAFSTAWPTGSATTSRP